MTNLIASDASKLIVRIKEGCSITFILIFSIFVGAEGLASTSIPENDRVRVLENARPIEDIELIDQDGHPFWMSQLHGHVALVFFGFTNCPDVCPAAMQRLKQLEESGGFDIENVFFVLISVDGDRDSPDVLKEYLLPYSARFVGLTGKPARVKSIAKSFSAAFFRGSATNDNGNYTISHSPQIFAVDSTGHLRAEFYNASTAAMKGVILKLFKEMQDPAEPLK